MICTDFNTLSFEALTSVCALCNYHYNPCPLWYQDDDITAAHTNLLGVGLRTQLVLHIFD